MNFAPNEIAPGVFDLAHPKNGYLKGGYVHAFLLVVENELLLIDTLYDPDAQVILDQISKLGKQVTDLKHILLTHGHRAHLGGLAKLKQLSGATVYAHAWEADIIAGDRKQQGVSLRPMKGLEVLPILVGGSLLAPLAQHKACAVDVLIDDGAQIGPLRALHTPGHTPGHLVFHYPAQRALFTGDAFVTWPLICPGWPNTMLNVKQTWESLRRISELDIQSIGVGHGEPIRANGAAVLRELSARGTV